MGLIKSANAPVSASPFSMKDVEKQAVALLAAARREAEKFLAAAQAEAEELKKQARAAGFEDGHAEGFAEGRKEGIAAGQEHGLNERRAELVSLVSTLTAAVELMNTCRLELEAAGLRDVLALSIAIAERVTKRLGVLDAQVAAENVAEAMKLVGHESDVRIAIHPSQKAVLEEVLPKLRVNWPAVEHVELVEDDQLALGGCRIFTARGHVDGDLDVQLRRIVDDLLPAKEGA